MKTSWLGAMAVVAALSLSKAGAAATAKLGRPAPPVTITTYDHQKIKLADLKGKVVVINIWATWCVPCKAEMPMMSGFHRRYKDQGFEIFGVTTEDSVPPRMLKNLAAVLSYPLALKVSGESYPILDGVPTSYVIDRSGVIRYAKAGSFDAEGFIRLILPLLREPAPAG